MIFAKITLHAEREVSYRIWPDERVGIRITEFHVIRPNIDRLLPNGLGTSLGRRRFEMKGSSLRGAVGQQRVPVEYLGTANIPLPPVPEQRRIVARIRECMERVDEIESNAATVALELDALFPALLNERFAEIRNAYGAQSLEYVADIRGGSSPPKGSISDDGGASGVWSRLAT